MQSSGIPKRSKISLDLYHLLFVRLPQVYRRQDALIHTVVGITLLVAIVIRICNYFGQNFEPLNFPTAFATAIPGLVVVWIVGMLAYSRYPKSGLFLSSFSQVFLFIMVCGYALASAITTPFTPIDPYLLKIDQVLHFSTTGLMAWTYHQPWLTQCLYFCYDTWFFQLALTPLLLALYKDQAEIDVFILATFVSFLIGSLIYYFCPTIAPAGLLHSQYFMHSQYELVTRFTQIHQHLPVTVYEGGHDCFSFLSHHQ